MAALTEFMRGTILFSDSNAELAEQLNAFAGTDLSAKGLKQMMNKWRYALEDRGMRFCSYRSNGQRLVEIFFSVVTSYTMTFFMTQNCSVSVATKASIPAGIQSAISHISKIFSRSSFR